MISSALFANMARRILKKWSDMCLHPINLIEAKREDNDIELYVEKQIRKNSYGSYFYSHISCDVTNSHF